MIAAPLFAQASSRVTYEFARLEQYTEPWHLLVLVAVCAAILAAVIWLYRRDSRQLRRPIAWLLLGLRVLALVGVLAFYLDPEKKTERSVVHNSRAVVIVDTSLSMAIRDGDASQNSRAPTRLEESIGVLKNGLLDRLRKRHDVLVVQFDATTGRIALVEKNSTAQSGASSTSAGAAPAPPADWSKIVPKGIETRLGQALSQMLDEQRSSPLAGIIAFTDGQQNAGLDAQAAADAARQAKVPIFPVGIGSKLRPANVRVSDFVGPARAYPGDSFTLTGYVQGVELAGRAVTVELSSRSGSAKPGTGEKRVEGVERVVLGPNTEATPVRFDITPAEAGRRTYELRVKGPPEDNNLSDNQQSIDVEIVDRKTRVLLVASGPTREYVFLRNQLRRDKQMSVDVWLQSARGQGISQDANQILDDFPSSPEELFNYDAIVAFDPDWTRLSAGQVDLIERWVSEKAGGLIAIAGPVEMDRWVQAATLSKIRALYPVEFQRRLSLLEEGRFGSDTPWPIGFTREGLEAEFLWLADSRTASQEAWSEFPGVYGFYPVRGAKPGATIYGRYIDSENTAPAEQSIFMAGQFYGAGRVFYLGSGEIWRLRALDESYFEQFYVKLVRHVSQGRLLLGSSRGMLLADSDRYPLGSTVMLRAQLSDARHEPLAVASVDVNVIEPDATTSTITLAGDRNRKGLYTGQFTALQEGTYRLEISLPHDRETLSRRIQVRVPDLERENTERNDVLLSAIAARSGGAYYPGVASIAGAPGLPPLAERLEDRTTVSYLSGLSDLEWEEAWLKALLLVIAGALALEWLVRRISKLA